MPCLWSRYECLRRGKMPHLIFVLHDSALRAAVLIQRWYRQYVARTEMRRRYTWHIFQSIEYSDQQAQIKVKHHRVLSSQVLKVCWRVPAQLQPSCFSSVQLYNFLGYLMDNFTPSSSERKISAVNAIVLFVLWIFISELWPVWTFAGNLISHIFRENDICRDTEWERYFCYKNIEVPEIYSGPHLTFPLTVEQAVGLLEAFRNKKVGARQQLHDA